MRKSSIFASAIAIVLLGLTGFTGWIISLPSPSIATRASPVPKEEANAMLAALAHDGNQRPLIATIGQRRHGDH